MSGLLLNYRNIFSTNLDDKHVQKVFSLRDQGLGSKSSTYESLERDQYALMRKNEIQRINSNERNIFSDRKMVRKFFDANKKDILRDLKSQGTEMGRKLPLSEIKNRIIDSTVKILRQKEKNTDRVKFVEDFRVKANSEERKNDLLLKKSFWEYEGKKEKFNATVNSRLNIEINKLQPDRVKQQSNKSKQEAWIGRRTKEILDSRVKVNPTLSVREEINNRINQQQYEADFKTRMLHIQQKEGRQISSLRVEHFYHQYKALKEHCERNKLDFNAIMNKSNLSVPAYKLDQLKKQELKLKPLTENEYDYMQKRTKDQGVMIQERVAKMQASEEFKNKQNKQLNVTNQNTQKEQTRQQEQTASKQIKQRDYSEQARVVANAKQKQLEEQQQKKKRLSV